MNIIRQNYTVTDETNGRSVQSVLEHQILMSASLIRDVKMRENGILLNGSRVYVNARVTTGDVLSVETSDKSESNTTRPIYAPFSVLYEDDELLIINKPAGITVHQSLRDENELTVENAVAYYLNGNCGIHPVNRLDKGTSGVMTIAKSAYSCELMRRILHTDSFTRRYIGIAVGNVAPKHGIIDLPTGFESGSRYKRAIINGGTPSKSEYFTLAANENYTLVYLIPHTGRTHQLRLHMSAIGFPLIGDWLYGTEDKSLIGRSALHSYSLHLVHPLTGKTLNIAAPLPDDMLALSNDFFTHNTLDELILLALKPI